MGSVRDPIILRQLDPWLEGLVKAARNRIAAVFGAGIESRYHFDVRVFGKNSTMGALENETRVGHEVGLLFQITAATQDLATSLMKSVGHIAVPYPVPNGRALT